MRNVVVLAWDLTATCTPASLVYHTATSTGISLCYVSTCREGVGRVNALFEGGQRSRRPLPDGTCMHHRACACALVREGGAVGWRVCTYGLAQLWRASLRLPSVFARHMARMRGLLVFRLLTGCAGRVQSRRRYVPGSGACFALCARELVIFSIFLGSVAPRAFRGRLDGNQSQPSCARVLLDMVHTTGWWAVVRTLLLGLMGLAARARTGLACPSLAHVIYWYVWGCILSAFEGARARRVLLLFACI